MQKYDYAEQVRDKLIKLLKLNPECKLILEYCKYNCRYNINSDATLSSVDFVFYDSIYCKSDGAYICPEYGKNRKCLEYSSFEELLEL